MRRRILGREGGCGGWRACFDGEAVQRRGEERMRGLMLVLVVR